ncbi:hypothetical protein VA7868_03096 [Vibrio aerogenes CECT 7868]|uniref:Flp pilus assembly protein RcpC/CpaB domain-containing protein n=1 Tax=Vibrio aerogenes CECT 7868 TaxID=1216006 RepID=A0A1M5ZRL6_9VIBR|nr:Flp pilus assembly protein CpaB [Vibrio aerogenes]SHI26749.1 hypothetical protein VA7868_03096 [Vibrio aerogenes CECT 7868]
MRSKLLMIMAIIAIGAGLAGIFFSGEKTPEPKVSVVKTPPHESVFYKVFRAGSLIKRGAHVHREDLEIVRLSESEARQHGIDGDSLFQLNPQAVYRANQNPGDFVLRQDIVLPDEPEFIGLTIAPDCVPYPVAVDPDAVVGGIIRSGSYVDVLALTGVSNRTSELRHLPAKNITINPVLTHIRVLKIEPGEHKIGDREKVQDHLILEVTRKQVAKLMVARQIARLEVYQSAGVASAKELRANAGDVLPDFKAVKELRANEIVVK